MGVNIADGSIRFQQPYLGALDQPPDRHQELHRFPPVTDLVVVGEGYVQHQSDRHMPFHGQRRGLWPACDAGGKRG